MSLHLCPARCRKPGGLLKPHEIGPTTASRRSIAWSSPVRREPASDRQEPGRGDAAPVVASPAGRREIVSSTRPSPLDPRDRGDEENAAQVTAFRPLCATGEGVEALRAQRHQECRQVRMHTGDGQFEAGCEQPVPPRVPAHHAPDTASPQCPGAGEQREQGRAEDDQGRLVRTEMQEAENERHKQHCHGDISLRGTTDSIQPRKMTSSTVAWNMKLTSSRLTGERHACPKPAACMPPAIQIVTTTSATVPNPTASPRRTVFSRTGPVSPMLASERPSTKRTQASTPASVGGKAQSARKGSTRAICSSVGLGFYPEITDCLERAENFWSCLTRRRRILGLWRRSMYSNTSDRAASSVGYFVR